MKRAFCWRWFWRAILVITLATMPGWSMAASGASAAPAPQSGWQTGWPAGQPNDAITALSPAPGSLPSMLAATSVAVYRTTDKGATWSAFAGGPQNVVAMATAQPSTIYVYSWPLSGPSVNPTRGLFKSVNGGSTWQDPTGGNSADQLGPVRTLVVQPGNAQVVLAGSTSFPASGNKISRSTDGGVTWTTVYTVAASFGVGSVLEVVPAPSNPNVFYAAQDVYHGGVILKSTDGGQNWGMLTGGLEPFAFPAALAVDPADANRVLVMGQFVIGSGVRLYKSTDGGQTWSKTGNGLPQTTGTAQALITDPTNGQLVFAALAGGNGGIYRSDDGGDNWTLVEGSTVDPLNNTKVLAFEPQSRTLFAGTGSGVWQKTMTPSIGLRFQDYYYSHDGLRVLGSPLSDQAIVNGWPSQYFEKGRLEDHSSSVSDPNWRFMFGLLADELQNAKANLPVGGEASTISYADLNLLADKAKRLPPPTGFIGGVAFNADNSVFVPYDANLAPAAGHNVPPAFWTYINRTDLFPGGWLHDIGLPMTEAVQAVVDKGDLKGRTIVMQAFQRTVLTYDPLNPPDWQIERANIGTDYIKSLPVVGLH